MKMKMSFVHKAILVNIKLKVFSAVSNEIKRKTFLQRLLCRHAILPANLALFFRRWAPFAGVIKAVCDVPLGLGLIGKTELKTRLAAFESLEKIGQDNGSEALMFSSFKFQWNLIDLLWLE